MSFDVTDKNWVTLSWAHDERFDEMIKFFHTRNINVKHRHMDGSIRGFLAACGKNYSEPIVFHGGHYIGNLEALKKYFGAITKGENNE